MTCRSIYNISQFDFVKNYPAFSVAVSDKGYTTIDYVTFLGDPFLHAFESDLRLECRGIKFDTLSGRIIARPLHKFFNAGERDGLLAIDKSHFTHYQPKLDGSMIHSVILNGEPRFMTRSGITDISIRAENLFLDREKALILANPLKTFIYEFTSPENRIVVSYIDPKLTLIATRYIISGEYVYDNIKLNKISKKGVSYHLRKCEKSFEEGIVLVNEKNGRRLKVKTDWYVAAHKNKEHLNTDWRVLSMILSSSYDDIKSKLSDIDKKQLELYSVLIAKRIDDISNVIDNSNLRTMTLKELAEELKNIDIHSILKSYCFWYYRNNVSKNTFIDYIHNVYLKGEVGKYHFSNLLDCLNLKYSEISRMTK